jgi:ATP-dependent exoDNAse (exonuclease V) beta subunit
VLDEAQASVLRVEAFDEALTQFCSGREPERLGLLAVYGSQALRRMLTGVHETLRAAGRALELSLGDAPGLDVAPLRAAAAASGIENAARLLELLDRDPPAESLLDLAEYAVKGDDEYEQARCAVEQAALNAVAARDRELLQELLQGFDGCYQAAKDRESGLDYDDLQLRARDLLRDDESIRAREQLRFRQVCVDEFQDTNRLQCELIDLVARDELFFVGDEFQSIYRFLHADVEVFKERRDQIGEVLPLTHNWRSRPEILDVVNHLFAATFGDEFQRLVAAGRFPDPASGPAVELLVTDKASYKDAPHSWRRGEAKAVARRVQELVESGEAEPGEIVVLFAAGTDAEQYEEELRAAGLPTYRATGRGYFGQQQVRDLLGYLRLLHNRYDDEALVTVLASPFVGVSNDALALLRRAAPRRPLFTGLEKGLPAGLAERDQRLLQAFRQRYDRLAALAGNVGLERLCEQILVEHDYDLAVLVQWDGRRRYANLRKLARLARSYEELRGPDIEGFVRFVLEQDAAGVKELEAVAEEEGAGAVRLLTIHAAKGLEFKVVVVADAGRERPRTSGEEIICLPDGRFGFKVVDPATGKRKPAFAYDEVRDAEEAAEEAERLRLYYVAMTRAIDRLIVAGSVDSEKRDARTPIGWVLDRLNVDALADGEIVRDEARLALRVDHYEPEVEAPAPELLEEGQLSLFEAAAAPPAPTVPVLPPLEQVVVPPERVRRLSYSALALFERCPYRFYAERLAGMRPVDGRKALPDPDPDAISIGLAASEIGDAVHKLLERVDLAAPEAPSLDQVLAWYPAASAEELERIGGLVQAFCGSSLAQRLASLEGVSSERPFAFEHHGVLFHGVLDVLHLADGRALVADFKSNLLGELSPADVVEAEYRLQRLVYAIACFRAGADQVEVVYQFLEQPDELVAATFRREQLPELEAELTAAIDRIQAGQFPPRPSEFACAGCPALDVVCAGPNLHY